MIAAATRLLEQGGRDSVTTRAVADAAGLQPPARYRRFGDEDGLLDAVAEHGFTRFLAAKQQIAPSPDDPVTELRVGWDTVVAFGLANPALSTAARPGGSRRRRGRSGRVVPGVGDDE
ncbi:TetR/AcrR family transcriptional regulator [Kitasatospora sp. NPDC089509]|uniref:TetR/AcrR family transcriptional regulator n=1 Tax=Kitasatospora sp. NPDC089509 TaxID=3364079 RepID=UPI00382B039C